MCLVLSFTLFSEKTTSDEKKESSSTKKTTEKSMFVEEVEVLGKIPVNRAIQSVTVYSKDEMEQFNNETLKSLLNQTAGFLVLGSGHPGQFAYSFARGASLNQTLFLIDGFKMTDPSTSIGLNLTFISPNLFEKIEIVRGPLGYIYGSNAMGGVINMKTREEEGIELTTFAGSHGTYEGNLYLSKKAGDFKFTLNGNLLRYSDGVENDEFKNRSIKAKIGYDKEGLKTGLIFFGNFADSGIPFSMGNPTPNRIYSQNNYLFALPFSYKFPGPTILNIKLSHNYNMYEFEDPDDTWNSYFMNKSIINEAQVAVRTKPLKNLFINTGIDYSDQKITNEDNTEKQLDDENTNYISAFLNAGLKLKRLFISASLRYDKYKDIDKEFSPQLGLSYLFSGIFKIRASYSENFRAPTLPELLNPMWGNPDLQPEKGKSFEIGADIYTKAATFSLVYFNSEYKNLIGFNPTTWVFDNLNEADISGIELSARVILFEQITLWAAYTYLDTYDIQHDQELLRRPKHSVSAMISYKHKYFFISGEMIYVGKRLDYDELLWETGESPSFNTFNFNLSIPLNEKLSLIGKATNAFNHEYQEVLGYPAPGSRFILGIKYKIM
jgi:vitamin B12 transporter